MFRGGDGTDALVLCEILVTDKYCLVGDLDSPQFVIDSGATIGLACVHFLSLYPDAQVVAVESDAKMTEL
jgi:hypothetical protein